MSVRNGLIYTNVDTTELSPHWSITNRKDVTMSGVKRQNPGSETLSQVIIRLGDRFTSLNFLPLARSLQMSTG